MRWLLSRLGDSLRRAARLTRLVDAYQIWSAQLGGWLTKVLVPMLAAALVWVTTYFQESWLPMATVAAVGAYIVTRELLRPKNLLHPVLRAELTELWQGIERTSDVSIEIRELAKASQEQQLSLMLLRDIEPRLDALRDELARGVSNIDYCWYAATTILDSLIENLLYQQLGAIRRQLPVIMPPYEQSELTNELIDEQLQVAEEARIYAVNALACTRLAPEVSLLLQRSERQAKGDVQLTWRETPPEGIDPYKYKDYVIAASQCDALRRFVMDQECKVEIHLGRGIKRIKELIPRTRGPM